MRALVVLVVMTRVASAEPTVKEVVRAAIANAGLAADPGKSMRSRARWAALAPWVTVRATRDLGWSDADTDVDHGEVLEVRATWRLDRLVFDASETRAVAMDGSRAKARRELTREVVHLFFRRQRLRADPAADPLELDEVTALLDELTGGRVSFTGPGP
jgi:hypothetical protein